MTTSIHATLDNLDETSLKMIQVVSVPPTKLAENEQLVSWSRRSTAANPVSATERYRAVIVHSSSLTIPDGATTSKFSALLQSTINSLADAKFTDYIRERMHEVEIPAAVISIDSVLAFWSEEKQRQTIDADKITTFLKGSETLAALNEQTQKVWLNKVPKIAAPNYRTNFSKGQAAAIVAKLAENELENPIAVFIATRCNLIITDESQEDCL